MPDSRVRFRDAAGTVRTGSWAAGTPGVDGRITAAGRAYDPEAVTILPPCEPSKIVCVGLNYADHAAERDATVPDRPALFLKPPSAVASHGDTIPLLPDRQIDYEAELAVVIGEHARRRSPETATDAVAGYTCMVDLSNRDDQAREQNWVRGKAFDGAAPLGPVVAPPAAVPADARIALRVNGEQRQAATRSELVFSVPELIAEITRYCTLEPGDVIATGTPAGVGPLQPGDAVTVTIEGVGSLAHSVDSPPQ
jgi:2-keto-4-pentenoate hydratase/2-oxohepta-3-ene-1,7-dioic acid hydratase in catechol pathway